MESRKPNLCPPDFAFLVFKLSAGQAAALASLHDELLGELVETLFPDGVVFELRGKVDVAGTFAEVGDDIGCEKFAYLLQGLEPAAARHEESG